MTIWTLLEYCGVDGDAGDAVVDYEVVKELHTEANLIDSYDAAVIEREQTGKVKIEEKQIRADQKELEAAGAEAQKS